MSCYSFYHSYQSIIEKIILASVLLSAHWNISIFLINFTRPSVYVKYKRGPRDEPYGTPDIESNVRNITLFTRI